jgi:hypothetical protein
MSEPIPALTAHQVRHELQVLSQAALTVRGAVGDPRLVITPFRLAVQLETLMLPLRKLQEGLIEYHIQPHVYALAKLSENVAGLYGQEFATRWEGNVRAGSLRGQLSVGQAYALVMEAFEEGRRGSRDKPCPACGGGTSDGVCTGLEPNLIACGWHEGETDHEAFERRRTLGPEEFRRLMELRAGQ